MRAKLDVRKVMKPFTAILSKWTIGTFYDGHSGITSKDGKGKATWARHDISVQKAKMSRPDFLDQSFA